MGNGGVMVIEGNFLPSESARIHSTQIDVVEYNARRQEHKFATKSNGLFAEFAVGVEWVTFDDEIPPLTWPFHK